MVEVLNVSKSFGDKTIFEDYTYQFKKGCFYIIRGESGCGKSTLLNMIGLLDKPDSGQICLYGNQVKSIHSKQARLYRKEKLGYVFQNYVLIEDETVYNNLKLVLPLIDKNNDKLISEALKQVGLENYENKKIYTLSGGEQQRISIARLLIKKCEIILADEPTGNLDKKNSDIIFNVFKYLKDQGKTIIMVTHSHVELDFVDEFIDL
ncbi:MAG: ATP-binding cassette domain-containing protein [Clostridia bacterium]